MTIEDKVLDGFIFEEKGIFSPEYSEKPVLFEFEKSEGITNETGIIPPGMGNPEINLWELSDNELKVFRNEWASQLEKGRHSDFTSSYLENILTKVDTVLYTRSDEYKDILAIRKYENRIYESHLKLEDRILQAEIDGIEYTDEMKKSFWEWNVPRMPELKTEEYQDKFKERYE
jgi:hypothetical protein